MSQYRELIETLNRIDSLSDLCGEATQIVITFRNESTKTGKNRRAVLTLLNNYGESICTIEKRELTASLAALVGDIDARTVIVTDREGPPSHLPLQREPRRRHVDPTRRKSKDTSLYVSLDVSEQIKLKNKLQDEMRIAASVGDYAKASLLRHRSIGVSLAIGVANKARLAT